MPYAHLVDINTAGYRCTITHVANPPRQIFAAVDTQDTVDIQMQYNANIPPPLQNCNRCDIVVKMPTVDFTFAEWNRLTVGNRYLVLFSCNILGHPFADATRRVLAFTQLGWLIVGVNTQVMELHFSAQV